MDLNKVKETIANTPCPGHRVSHRGRTVGECLPADVVAAIASGIMVVDSDTPADQAEPAPRPRVPGSGDA